jgi:hypothetical protein
LLSFRAEARNLSLPSIRSELRLNHYPFPGCFANPTRCLIAAADSSIQKWPSDIFPTLGMDSSVLRVFAGGILIALFCHGGSIQSDERRLGR